MGDVLATETERRVRFEDGDLDGVRMMVRAPSSELQPGDVVEVEVGARWHTRDGHRERVAGHWVQCVIVHETHRELVVKLVA